MLNDKRLAGKTLFIQGGYTQTQISKMLRVSETTISKWSNDDNWKDRKIEQELFKEDSLELVRKLILHNLKVINRRVNEWTNSDKEEDRDRIVERGDIDALTKLFSTIKNDERKWSHYVQIMRDFTSWMANHDSESAKSLIEPIDKFLNEKRQSF